MQQYDFYLQHNIHNTPMLRCAAGCYTGNMPLLERLIAPFTPFDCLVCGKEGSLLCGFCAQDALIPLPSRCYRCKKLTTDFKVCEKCRKHTVLKHAWIATSYDGMAQQLVKCYKFERARSAGTILADAIEAALPLLSKDTLVIPVPTATSRMRIRGYDQAQLLARELAKARGLAYLRAVTRISQSRQVGATRKQRHEQLKNAFLVTHPSLIKNQNVLIIDDVTTTGATLEAIATVLKQAGAKTVTAAVFAQRQ